MRGEHFYPVFFSVRLSKRLSASLSLFTCTQVEGASGLKRRLLPETKGESVFHSVSFGLCVFSLPSSASTHTLPLLLRFCP